MGLLSWFFGGSETTLAASTNTDTGLTARAVRRSISEIISHLPVIKDKNSFYDLPDVTSRRGRGAWLDAAEQFRDILGHCRDEDAEFQVRFWAKDIMIALEDFEGAINIAPSPSLGARASYQTDTLLTLKHAVGLPIVGKEVATLFGPKLTAFGKENIDDVSRFLDVRVTQMQTKEGRNLLEEWRQDAHFHPHGGISLFSGHASYVLSKAIRECSFSRSPTAEKFCIDLMRDAENTYREERNIPRVGEGWIAETTLFYDIKAAFPDEIVTQHGRPWFLGRQHLDIYLPERKLALEYQGEQHDQPVAFFGGEEAFRANQERDRRKLAICKRNGVRIIYVRRGYSLEDVIADLRSSFTNSTSAQPIGPPGKED